jgi:hypothetical protein
VLYHLSCAPSPRQLGTLFINKISSFTFLDF